MQRQPRLGRGIARYHRFHRYGFHYQRLARHQKGETLAVGGLKTGLNLRQAAKGHYQRRVAALVAHMHALEHRHRAGADLLALQLALRGCRQGVQFLGNLGQGLRAEPGLHRLLFDDILVRQPHAIGAQYTRQRMHKHTRHAQRVGHQAGMLATSATKALQGVAGHVVAARHRYLLDGIGHLLHRDVDKAFGNRLGRAAGLLGEDSKLIACCLKTQRLVGLRPEHFGEIGRLHFAHHHVGIGHCQRAAAPVARRPGIRPGTLRPHTKTLSVKLEQGAAARRHGVDAHHRCAHAHPGHLGFELALKLSGVMRHVGRCASHVKTDHLGVPAQTGGARHAHNATGRAAQYCVFAGKGMGVGQTSGRLHEEQFHARHLGRHLLHIARENG